MSIFKQKPYLAGLALAYFKSSIKDLGILPILGSIFSLTFVIPVVLDFGMTFLALKIILLPLAFMLGAMSLGIVVPAIIFAIKALVNDYKGIATEDVSLALSLSAPESVIEATIRYVVNNNVSHQFFLNKVIRSKNIKYFDLLISLLRNHKSRISLSDTVSF